MSPKVSIIVPVYNAEKTLPRMLDAIKAQTFEDYEVILINDGSGDGSEQVMRKYSEEDERFRVYSQENKGVSAARNAGLDYAQGEYILFYDADDSVPEDAVQKMYHRAREKMADLVVGKTVMHYMSEQSFAKPTVTLSELEDIPKNKTTMMWNFSLCNKMFRKAVIDEHHIRFNGTSHGEDGVFLYEFIRNSETMVGCEREVYNYYKKGFMEESSLSQSVSTASFRDICKNFETICRTLDAMAEEELAKFDETQQSGPAWDEERWRWRRLKATVWKRFAGVSILNEYYRMIWRSDEDLYPLLKEWLKKCEENMLPSQWQGLLEDHADLQLESGLLSKEELAENPLISVIISDKLPSKYVNKVLSAYYHQIFPSFEVLVDESMADAVAEEYKGMMNLHFLEHRDTAHWKKEALQQAKATHCIFVEEPIYPVARTIRQMFEAMEKGTFITAPLLQYSNGEYKPLKTQSTAFINEFMVVYYRSPYNQLDSTWGNKIFNVKNLLAKKRLFEKKSETDMNRLYNNSKYTKFTDNSFVTDLTDQDILKRVEKLSVKLGYPRKLRQEAKRLARIEKESTRIVPLSLRLKKWRNKKLRQGYKFLTLKVIFPLYYKWHARKPIEKNKVLFVVNRKPTLPNSMTYVHSLLEKSGKFDIHNKFLLNLSLRYRQKFKVDLEFIKDLATANYVFLDEATVTTCGIHKRPETKIVQLWHGCGAFKKFGFSTADKIFGGNAKEQSRYPMYRNFDLVCVSSPEVVWAYEEAMQLEGEGNVKPVGVSRTDVFFRDDYIEAAKKRVIEQIPAAAEKKIILYAPTFRGRVAKAYGPDQFNYDKLYEALGDEYIILIKHHPLVKKLPDIPLEYRDSFAYDVSRTMEIEDLICASDICISDYSSLIFEYSLFEKPIILFAYDLDVYFDWRGFYYDYFEMAPGPVLISTEEIIDYITHIDTKFDREKMHAFREKFMRSCDGHSTERILDEVGLKL